VLVTSVYHSIDDLKEGRTATLQYLYIFIETRMFLMICFHAVDIWLLIMVE